MSRYVSFIASGACLSYVPAFVAKTESSSNPLPRSFLVKSLSDFATGFEVKSFLCPVRDLHLYLGGPKSLYHHPRLLFVSPHFLSQSMSKNGISYFLREVIYYADASRDEGVPVSAHCIWGVSTSTAFHRNLSVSSVLVAATWRSTSVFAAFYQRFAV